MWPTIVFALFAYAIGVGRFFIPGHELSWAGSYEALAHLWVGYTICLIWPITIERRDAVFALVALTFLEAMLFFNR